jgi:hypothetical protein
MIPFKVKMGNTSVGITFESLFWFFIVTAGATVVGELVYAKWVQPYLNRLPMLPNSVTGLLPPAPGSVVSTQTPSASGPPQMQVAGFRRRA